ncbi:hypothetical protein AALP_AA6G135400 [Arabis alpina]|uniref:Uncharacterized protein n=1 Tax=Arabis alpina TaxID=50452 RepID=A0A087GP08_ARAAL|nr:hypothetical protein AALP_AA6G135400 [Arabis alpina]
MNLISRTLTKVVYSSLHHSRAAKLPTQKWVISQQIRLYTVAVTGKISTGGSKPKAKASDVATEKEELARPKMIEYKQEIANWVNLIGFVDQPIQFESNSDGKFWAGTVISQRSAFKASTFWIPIIFEGELAKIAAHHVKKDDRIHVSGKLFIDSPLSNVTYPQSNVQIMVQNLNFVEAMITPTEKEEIKPKKRPARSKKVKVIDEETSNAWMHLLENPKEWLDYRGNKASGLVKPRHPDFKCKDGGLALWLSSAPDWVLPELQGLGFDVSVPIVKLKQLKGEESWKDLVQNPDKWLDTRSEKTNPKAPDFKHKETNEALWMTDSPTWVLSKLPPLKKKQEQPLGTKTVSQPVLKPLKNEESWKDLVQNPDKWFDNRSNKTNAKAPDFMNNETGEPLWMNNSPTWVLSKLPPLKKRQEPPLKKIQEQPLVAKPVSLPMLKRLKSEEFWKDLVQNPDKWWDNRSIKRSAKSPDFRHKDTGEGLWMSDSPVWALSKLPPLKKNQETPVMA